MLRWFYSTNAVVAIAIVVQSAGTFAIGADSARIDEKPLRNHSVISQAGEVDSTDDEIDDETGEGIDDETDDETDDEETDDEEIDTGIDGIDVDPSTAEDEMEDIEKLLPSSPQEQFDRLSEENFYRTLRGSLPCIEYSAVCVLKLQSLAVAKSPLLSSVDEKLELIAEAIDEANALNEESKKLSILRPALVYLATPESVSVITSESVATERVGLLNRLVSIVTNPVSLVNELVGSIAQPLSDFLVGGSDGYKQSNIAIAGLNAEAANLRIDRQTLELEIRKVIDERLAACEDSIREYRLALGSTQVAKQQESLYRISFASGDGTLEQMLALEARTSDRYSRSISAFQSMRLAVNRLKFLAYGGSFVEE